MDEGEGELTFKSTELIAKPCLPCGHCPETGRCLNLEGEKWVGVASRQCWELS